MKKISDIFEAKTQSIKDILRNGHGYKIPVYQRDYNWSKDNIDRLFESIGQGFKRLTSHDKNNRKDFSPTFLGSLILIEEKNKEEGFQRTSLAIIDGQQRITTISLIILIFIEQLESLRTELEDIEESPKGKEIKWLDEQIQRLLGTLKLCIEGKENDYDNKKYPKLIREFEDYRGSGNEYLSIIAQRLTKYITTNEDELKLVDDEDKNITYKKNIELMIEKIQYLKEGTIYTSGDEPITIDLEDLQKYNSTSLIDGIDNKPIQKLTSLIEASEQKSTIKSALILLFYIHYFLDRVIFTSVTIQEDNEYYAFDIFESLNTTGEPLSALQTLKPQVIEYLKKNGQKDIKCAVEIRDFEAIEKYFDQFRDNNNKIRQTENIDITSSYCYYAFGTTPGNNLSGQRKFLREKYKNLAEKKSSRVKNFSVTTTTSQYFTKGVLDIIDYKTKFWNDKHGAINTSCSSIRLPDQNKSSMLTLLLSFIAKSKTTLTIPILARYWDDKNHNQFAEAVQITAAFMVIWRCYRGKTAGIDKVFKDLLRKNNFHLLNNDGGNLNEVLNLTDLKKHFISALQKEGIDNNKSFWLSISSKIPLYNDIKPLCKLILILVHENAQPTKEKGLMIRKKFSDFININWDDNKIATVEHIAPQEIKGLDWDDEIKKDPDIVHCIGNLTLLPKKANAYLGNKSWKNKKLVYKVLAADENEYKQAKREAENAGINIKDSIKDKTSLKTMLDPIIQIDDWKKEVIVKRSENYLSIVWDVLYPWINDDIEKTDDSLL